MPLASSSSSCMSRARNCRVTAVGHPWWKLKAKFLPVVLTLFLLCGSERVNGTFQSAIVQATILQPVSHIDHRAEGERQRADLYGSAPTGTCLTGCQFLLETQGSNAIGKQRGIRRLILRRLWLPRELAGPRMSERLQRFVLVALVDQTSTPSLTVGRMVNVNSEYDWQICPGNLKPLDSYFGTDTSGLHREQKRMVALSSPVRYSIEGDGFLFRSCPVLSCWWPEKLTEAQDRKVNNVWKVWRWVVI